jgi:O-antigen/teichoic acid export membrane protein
MVSLKNNYYVSSFFWSTTSRVLTAVVGFFTVPLLLGLYGKANYGILALATSCNGYMQLLDLGMNTGAVKYFSQWKAEGKTDLIKKVSGTNVTFYLIISAINILLLLILAAFGEPLFNITHEQFITLRKCLIILAIFNVFSWETTPFQQLLQADKQIGFTMKMQSVGKLLQLVLVGFTIGLKLPLTTYFFFLTVIVALLIIPFAYKCRKDKLTISFRPQFYWKEFRIVLTFSLAIFALGLFQATATQSRPIILSMFSKDGAGIVADFRILEVIPSFIIMLSGTFGAIFLPKAAEMVARKDKQAIENFAYKWTRLTSIVVCALCFPFIIGSKEALSAYVGPQYSNLSHWLNIWILTVLWQMHTTPANALVLSYGKTRLLVIVTAINCTISMIVNAFLCKYLGVGSAILAYFLYVLVIIGLYYLFFYKKLLGLSRVILILDFIKPALVALISFGLCCLIPFNELSFWNNNRIYYIAMFVIKSVAWFIPYAVMLFGFKLLTFKELRNAR